MMKNSSCLFPRPLPNFPHYKLGDGLGMRSSQHITRLLSKLSPWNKHCRDPLGVEQGYMPAVIYIVFTGIKVVLVVNNLGGTSNLELSIVANAAIRHLGM